MKVASKLFVALMTLCLAGLAFLITLPFWVSGPDATVSDRLRQCGQQARSRLLPHFEKQGVVYPPKQLVFLGLKEEKQLELYAAGERGELRFIRAYPILAASGTLGPKLREGDGQVPEGLYRIESLNPNSMYHLSLRVNYPNEFDRAQAKREGRTNLGGDIMIHGRDVSIGCLAMGDEAAEDLFVLAAETGLKNIRVVLSPVDFRVRAVPPLNGNMPPWTKSLHDQIRNEIMLLKK